MQIKTHKLVGAEYVQARVMGGGITPEVVVLHDTAGRLEKYNSRNYLATTPKASVHFVVERDGTISQLVPTNRRAGHAGESSYHGRADVNAFSIGIEIVNPGRMTRAPGGFARAWWKQDFGAQNQAADGTGAYEFADITTPQHGAGVWMDYTPMQIEAVEALLVALFAGIKTLRDITTHWYISPGRKVDVNPLFPLDALRVRVLGHDDPAQAVAEAGSTPVIPGAVMATVRSPSSDLNVRRWPSFNPNIIGTVPDKAEVPVLRRGTFDKIEWVCIRYCGQEGWVVARYLEIIQTGDKQ